MLAPRSHRVIKSAGWNSALRERFSQNAAPVAVLTLFLTGCNFTKPIPVDDAFMHAHGSTAVAVHQAVPEPKEPEKPVALPAPHPEPVRQTRLAPAPVRNTVASPASPVNSARPASPAWSPTLRVSAREKETPNVVAAVPTPKSPVLETAGNVADETQKAVVQIEPRPSQRSPGKRTGLKWWAWTGLAALLLLLLAGAAALPAIRERIMILVARAGVMFGETQLRLWPRRRLKLGGGSGKNGAAAAAAAVVLKGLEVPRKKEEVPKPPEIVLPVNEQAKEPAKEPVSEPAVPA